MITLVKFIRNRMPDSDNYLITRTLGKVGVVKKELYLSMSPRPQHDEFWYVEILDEVKPNQVKGCWILKPLYKIGTVDHRGFNEPDIVRLIPGTFDIDKRGSTLYIYPHNRSKDRQINWILDVEVRHALTRKYRTAEGTNSISSVVVIFDEEKPPKVVTKPKQQSPSLNPLLDLDTLDLDLDDE